VHSDYSTRVARTVDTWLDHVAFAVVEVYALTVPVLLVLLVTRPLTQVSLSTLAALAGSTLAVGTYRSGVLGSGRRWPRPGHVRSVPGRAAYYGLVLATATFVGLQGQLQWGGFLPGVVLPPVVALVALAPTPMFLEGTRTLGEREYPV
jgi:hypothetical protein